MNKARNTPLSSATAQKYDIDVLNEVDNTNSCIDIRKWRRYLQVLTQLIGLISVKGDKDFENRQNLIFECCYANGSVILTHFDGRLQIWTRAGELKVDANGDIEYADVIPFAGLGNTSNVEMKAVRITGKNLVYVKSAPFGLSLWVLWDRILQDNVELMEIYLTNAKLNVKKMQYIINNDSTNIVNEELKSIMDYKSPVIKTINPITKAITGDIRSASGEQNLMQPIDLGSVNYSFDDVVNHWIFETNLMGLYADEYHKKERNTTGENEMTQANTVLIHEVYLREWKRAEREINEKFGLNVEFYKTFELSVEEAKPEQEEGEQDEVK